MFIMKHLIYIFIIIILILTIFNIYNNYSNNVIYITKTDTIVKIDTIIKENPVPIEVKSKPDTIYLPSINDSVIVDRETHLYKDSTYECQISGIEPSLDYLKVFPRETTIYVEKVQEIAKKQPLFQIKPTIGVGYGLKNKKIEPFVGIGVQINL